ncbi:unnamed protein product [Mytilus coruscus]|uniref:Uncharacterized protein n=1 Tax=Mytilus coruscus TaxID=42192 RepID=A0A6J8CZA6_MYTCO|nr:unnamed protein product [Mytilus coruscus]
MEREETLSPYAYGLPAEARTRYKEKLHINKGTESLPNPYTVSNSEWVNDPSMWPELDFGQVYLYLMETPAMFSKTSMKAYKSLEAYRYVERGHVDQIKIDDVKGSPICFLKADVIGSMKIRDKPHQIWGCLAKDTADIYCAHCTSLAGKLIWRSVYFNEWIQQLDKKSVRKIQNTKKGGAALRPRAATKGISEVDKPSSLPSFAILPFEDLGSN